MVMTIGLKQRFTPERWFTLRLAIGDFVISDEADLLTISEVVTGEEYSIEGLQPETIVDIGSHIGSSVVFFRDRYPYAEIIGVEPDPSSFAKLTANTGHLARVQLHNCAVADRSGEAPFYVAERSWGSSLVSQHPGQAAASVRVRTLDEIIGERTIDLLKLDIEGAEYAALSAFRGLCRVSAVAVEYHADTCPASLGEFLELLAGFRIVRMRGDSAHHLVIVALREARVSDRSAPEPSAEALKHPLAGGAIHGGRVMRKILTLFGRRSNHEDRSGRR